MARAREYMAQRGHDFAIVDEVDSILIDEARTPLIISGPADEAAQLYYQFASIARTLTRDVDYEVDEEKKTVVPLESGIEKVEQAVGVENIYDDVSVNYVHQLTKALTAKDLYKRDKDYLVAGGEVKIIDEFTGRTLEGRRWSDGLHQAVEAKERVPIKEENHTWATVTLQNYFRMYDKLSGMTGTAETEAGEFAGTYALPVVPIPTNKEMIRADNPDLVFKTEEAKFNAVVDDIVERNEMGQPMLIGTASVAKSELLSRLLEKRGIRHNVLNAKQHFREAEVVAQAGRRGAVTVATNMAGRGVDIILGGNPELLAQHELAADGVDLDSEEGLALLDDREKEVEARCRAEGEEVRKLGGLYVLGSERHESRRIDNQLRGRSGRQGDPGESRFYLSLDDELLRLFATGAMSWVMGRTLPEDVPIESKTVAKAIERAQNTVEARNAEMRKDALKYDEVMDQQRKVIYERRLQIIDGDDLEEHTEDLLAGAAEKLVAEHCPTEFEEDWDLKALVDGIMQYYPTKFTVGRPRAGGDDRGPRRVHRRGGARLLRAARRGHARRRGDDAPDRARRVPPDHGRPLARPPVRDGQPQGRHPPALDRPGRPPQRLAAGGLQHVRPAARGHRQRLPALHPPCRGCAAGRLGGAGPGQGGVRRRRRPRGRDLFPGRRAGSRAGRAGRLAVHAALAGRGDGASQAAQADGADGADGAAGNGSGSGRQRQRGAKAQVKPAERARPRRGTARCQGPDREGRPERALLVRERQEVQVLPWRRLTPPRPAQRDPATSPAELAALGDRLAEAERYLGRDKLEARRAELEAEVAKPDLWDDQDNARSVTQELGRVTDDLDQLDGLRATLDDARALLELTEESAATDRDATSTPSSSRRSTRSVTRLGALELQSLFSGEYDELDAVCEVHAGAGGTDAQDWTEMLLRMYQRWAERRGFTVELDEATEGQEAGLLSATFIVQGRFAYGLMATERGVHRLVRMSPFDSQHRRQTSFASVEVTPFLEDASEVEIDEKDLRIDTYRSSGAGGQHVNKTDSAVRLTHLPTGDRGGGPERAQPAPEQGEGDADPRGQADRAGPGRAPGRARRSERRARRQRVGQPDPLVRDGALPVGQGPADELRDGQRRRRPRRGPRRVHGSGVAAPTGVRRVGVRPPLRCAAVRCGRLHEPLTL